MTNSVSSSLYEECTCEIFSLYLECHLHIESAYFVEFCFYSVLILFSFIMVSFRRFSVLFLNSCLLEKETLEWNVKNITGAPPFKKIKGMIEKTN